MTAHNPSPFLVLEAVGFAYGKRQVMKSLSLSLAQGQFACLLGPSGSGKTTLLRLIAGLESASSGGITLDGEILTDGTRSTPPEARHTGMVFQQPTLFPTLTVAENIAFGLGHLSPDARTQRVCHLLSHAAIAELADRYPHQLSGGQQHRVALARALAPSVKLLLLDEPFSHLDPALRAQLGRDTRALAREEGITCLMVTHDASEAMQLSDIIFLMDEYGHIHQSGTPHALYHHPVNRYAAQALGDINLLPARADGGSVHSALGVCANPGGLRGEVEIAIRPEHLVIDPLVTGEGAPASITGRYCSGASDYVELALESGQTLRAAVSAASSHGCGDAVKVRLQNDYAHLYAAR